MMLQRGDADGMLCGTVGTFDDAPALHREVIGRRAGVTHARGHEHADAARIARCSSATPTSTPIRPPSRSPRSTLLAADEIRRFGLTPKVALLSHSRFGSRTAAVGAEDARGARRHPGERDPELDVEGEMHGDAALSKTVRDDVFPNSRLAGDANLLIMPSSMPPTSRSTC